MVLPLWNMTLSTPMECHSCPWQEKFTLHIYRYIRTYTPMYVYINSYKCLYILAPYIQCICIVTYGTMPHTHTHIQYKIFKKILAWSWSECAVSVAVIKVYNLYVSCLLYNLTVTYIQVWTSILYVICMYNTYVQVSSYFKLFHVVITIITDTFD